MRRAFAHDAFVNLEDDSDPNALGGAVTVEVCGQWNHPGQPCPLAPHHTSAEDAPSEVYDDEAEHAAWLIQS